MNFDESKTLSNGLDNPRLIRRQMLYEELEKLPATGITLPPLSAGTLRNSAAKPDHVKRPLNSYMIFSILYRLKQRNDQSMMQANISAGQRWKQMSDEEKEPYEIEAKRECLLHQIKHPDYKYRPKRRKTKKEKKLSLGDSSTNHQFSSTALGRVTNSAVACSSLQFSKVPSHQAFLRLVPGPISNPKYVGYPYDLASNTMRHGASISGSSSSSNLVGDSHTKNLGLAKPYVDNKADSSYCYIDTYKTFVYKNESSGEAYTMTELKPVVVGPSNCFEALNYGEKVCEFDQLNQSQATGNDESDNI